MKTGFGSKVMSIILKSIMLLVCIILLYPFVYCFSYALSDSKEVMIRNVVLLPVGFTFQNLTYVLENKMVFNAFTISVLRTAGGIAWAVLITGLASYALSKRYLPGNRLLSIFCIVPMYITGGLLPTYVLMHDLHLFNNYLVYILPYGFWGFNMLLMRTFFDTIPVSLEESAKLDGANDWVVLVKIIFPLSMPIISVIAMYTGVWHWNAWFDAILYITKQEMKPLQSLLQRILMESLASTMEAQSGRVSEKPVSSEAIKMATLIVSTLPIIFIYPFFQKYFIKGVMIGAVKA